MCDELSVVLDCRDLGWSAYMYSARPMHTNVRGWWNERAEEGTKDSLKS